MSIDLQVNSSMVALTCLTDFFIASSISSSLSPSRLNKSTSISSAGVTGASTAFGTTLSIIRLVGLHDSDALDSEAIFGSGVDTETLGVKA